MITNSTHVTHRTVLKIAVPMIISNITTPILGLVDTAVVGHLGDASYLGAVAMGGLLFGFLYWSFGFLRMSTTGIAAQAVGRQDGDELRAILIRSIFIALLIAMILLVVKQPLARIGFDLLSASPAVESKALNYYLIRIWSAPFTLINYTLIGWYLGAQTAKAPLLITLAINLTNIVLDLVFVLHWKMGVEGVALASVLAEIFGVVVDWCYCQEY
jgi:MATE family multidrug resistance protein